MESLSIIKKQMEFPVELLLTITKKLENHSEALRIKKFIYCLNKKKWENDLQIVNQYFLDQLLVELIEVQPTINRLSLAMYELVKSLNRQQTYLVIAQSLLEELAPVYNANQEELENSQLNQLFKRELARKNSSPRVYINLMEVLVKESVFQELEKLPLKITQSLNVEEIIAYSLNHLPTLYVTSEEGKIEQLKKARLMKNQIHLVVIESIKIIMQNPLRNSTPLKIRSIFFRKNPD